MNIDVQSLTLKYGDATAVSDLDLTVEDGEALVLLGQSGCGKTSTMRCIAGLETPSTGHISIGGDVVFDGQKGVSRPPHKRNIGMVFQSYAIWPHLTVFENVAFPLQMKGERKATIAKRAAETLELVGLEHLADRGASLLSGGQMQRVALARSLVMEPSVLLLDEPLSNLDARLRHRLRTELRELQQRLGLTSIYVTHDQDEALALADRIALMQFGRIVQIGSPTEIYSQPLSASIAEFLGVSNVLPSTAIDPTTISMDGTNTKIRVGAYTAGENLRACIRAEDIHISSPSEGDAHSFEADVVTVAFQGATVNYRVRLADAVELDVLAPKRIAGKFQPGDHVSLSIAPTDIQVLPLEVAVS